jgi:hypothetical protein
VKVANESSGTSGTFQPNRNSGADETIGTYHTHPYDEGEGGHKGVSFSSADIAYATRNKEPIYVDAGDKPFMIMPTGETPALDQAALDKDWNDQFKASSKAGKSFQESCAAASAAVAKKYKMVYYEGADGTLERVVP